jgi:acetylornithine/succinyldiaminopimelate/putrescine aminotransferase
MTRLALLDAIRSSAVGRRTDGLERGAVAGFLESDGALAEAIDLAHARWSDLRKVEPALMGLDEPALIERLLRDYVNFYPTAGVAPYVPLAARGPWIVTTHGAVVHDNGGYGMLGLGHAPPEIDGVLGRPYVMANVMTPSFSQHRFAARLREEIGHRRSDGCPFARFLCMNSGSEAMSVAAKISDLRAGQLTGPGGRHEGKRVVRLSLKGSFHGRTQRPSQFSDSTRAKAEALLATWRGPTGLFTVPINDIAALEAAFAAAEADGRWFEAFCFEPVQGEGNPGVAVTPAFYAAARRLCDEHDTLLIADSIQAGLRTHGVLSLVDYPGFEALPPPDIESYSKALNAGQFPLSVLAMRAPIADLYVTGLYGNTMTTNPRGLEVACAVLDALTPALRDNIVARGEQLYEGLRELQREFPDAIRRVDGTGLIVAAELDPTTHPVNGAGAIEERLRRRGIGVVHGGANALRFTPWFGISEAEVELVLDVVGAVLRDVAEAAA